MLTSRYKETFNRLLEPLGRGLAGCGVSANALTIAIPALVSLACLWFARTRHVLAFCVVILLIGCLDGLDGVIARVSARATKFGAYLDAMADRYVEAIVVLSAAYVTGYWALSAITLFGAILVSYAKARAAMEVSISNLEWPDLMERTERSFIFVAGLAASLIPWRPLGHDLFWWTLLALAMLTQATVVQRMLRAHRFITERSKR